MSDEKLTLSQQREAVESRPRVPDAPVDLLDVVRRAAGVPRYAAARVLVVLSQLDRGDHEVLRGQATDALGVDVVNATIAVSLRMQRLLQLARSAARAEAVEVPVAALLPPSPPEAICLGCPDTLPCGQTALSTPEECRRRRHRSVPAHVVRATGGILRLRCAHPAGEYDVRLEDLLSAMSKEH